jgi:hypothetical protein
MRVQLIKTTKVPLCSGNQMSANGEAFASSRSSQKGVPVKHRRRNGIDLGGFSAGVDRGLRGAHLSGIVIAARGP